MAKLSIKKCDNLEISHITSNNIARETDLHTLNTKCQHTVE